MELAKHQLFVIQPTTLCNLDCSYCWLPERHVNKYMSRSVFRQFLQRVGNAAENLDRGAGLVWHGGEPLVLGATYYRQCLEDLREVSNARGFSLKAGIQTNGVLLDHAWINLFKEYDVQIGVSVDGPAWLHDRRRIHRNGKGTHSEVERGMELLSQADINFSIISVLSDDSLDHADEIYAYLRTVRTKNGFAFNIDENDGANITSSILDRTANQEAMHERVRRFFLRIFELNEEAGRALKIRDFTKFYSLVDGTAPLGGESRYSSMVTSGALINIDHAGNFSTYCPELVMGHSGNDNPFVFGNVMDDDFGSMISDKRFSSVSKDIASGREKCRATCDYFMVCGGGSPSNRYSELKTLDASETLYCKNHVQATADAVLDYIEGLRSGPIKLTSESRLSRLLHVLN